MTDYELVNTLYEVINTTWMIFTAYVSIVFAFLVAGYLAADKLTSRMTALVIALYTQVALWAIFAVNRNIYTVVAVLAEIRRAVNESESSLMWLPQIHSPEIMDSALPILVTLITVLAYAGSIVFYFNQRKNPAKTNSGE